MRSLWHRLLLTLVILGLCTTGVMAQEDGQARVIVCLRGSDAVATQGADGYTWQTLMDVTNVQGDGLSTQSLGENETKTLMLVTSDILSTQALIADLEGREEVLFAEEDVPITLDEEYGATASEDGLGTQAAGARADYSKFQWLLNNTGKMTSGMAGYDVGNTQNLKGNTEVIMAVMDTGLDYDNPSLSQVVYNLPEDLKTGTKAANYGYNAAAPGEDIMDVNGHGTHCAGIMAADGTDGVSGVMTNGLKLVGVKVMGDDGYIYLSSMVSGWNWLVTAKNNYGVNLRGVNVSIGGTYATQAISLAVATADAAGITTIFASGNDAVDVDLEQVDVLAYHKGSTLVVNSMEASGKASPFSNYGLTGTDLYAPGSAILSTSASKVATFNAFTAAQDDARILVYEGCEAAGEADEDDPDQKGGLDFYTFDETAADGCGEAVPTTTEDYFYGKQGLNLSADGREVTTIISKPVTLTPTDTQRAETLYRGYCTYSPVGRAQIACDFRLTDGSFSATKAENMGGMQWRNAGNSSQSDATIQKLPDNVDFEHFQMKITISYETTTDQSLTLDDIGVGTGLDTCTVYGGTSMASPATAGAFALLASNHPAESSAKISARLVGGTMANEDFAGKCVSGGQVNIDTAHGDTILPVVQASGISGRSLTLKGWFLESSGQVSVDGVKAEVTSWEADTDTQMGTITLALPEGVSGLVPVTITTQSGLKGEKYIDVGADGGFTDLSLPQGEGYDNTATAVMTTLNDKIYLLTLLADETIQLWEYQADDDTWTYCGVGPTLQSTYIQMAGCQGSIYILDSDSQSFTGILYQIDPATMKTETVTTSEPIPYGAAMVSDGKNLVFVGGVTLINGLSISNAILEMPVNTGKITTRGVLPEGLFCAYAVINGDTLMVTGGGNFTEAQSSIYVVRDQTVETYKLPAYAAGQSMAMAVAPTAQGLILSGPVVTDSQGLTGASAGVTWQDTWDFDMTTGQWSWSGKTLNSRKTLETCGVQMGDAFYVWGVNQGANPLTFFRKTTIDPPVPTPSPTVTPSPTAGPIPTAAPTTAPGGTATTAITTNTTNATTGIDGVSVDLTAAIGLAITGLVIIAAAIRSKKLR